MSGWQLFWTVLIVVNTVTYGIRPNFASLFSGILCVGFLIIDSPPGRRT